MDWCHDPEEHHEVEGRQDALYQELSHVERLLLEVWFCSGWLKRSGSEALMDAQENVS